MSTSPLASPSPAADRMAAMSGLLAQNWWALALRGAMGILFGVLAVALPGVTLATLVLLFAAYMLVDGVFAIVAAVRAAGKGRRWGLLALEGVADIAAGLVAFVWPAISVLVFVYLVSFWSILSGILLLAAAFRLDATHGRWWMGFSGAFSVIFGIAVLLAPGVAALAMTLWLGVYAIVFGAMLLALAFRLRSRHTGRIGDATARSAAL